MQNKTSLPYCRRCDLFVNDGVRGMYCVCTARRLRAAAEAESLAEARRAAARASLAQVAAEAQTRRNEQWRPRI